MDLVFILAIAGGLWVQSWYLLGHYSNPRTLGLVAAAVAIILLGVVLFPVAPVVGTPLVVIDKVEQVAPFFVDVQTALSAFILMWALYEAIVAGVYLWGLDTRTLGFYNLLLWIASGAFAAYMFLGGELLNTGVVEPVSWLLGVVAVALAIPAALLWVHLAFQPIGVGEPSASTFRNVTGSVSLIASIGIGILGLLMVLGLQPSF